MTEELKFKMRIYFKEHVKQAAFITEQGIIEFLRLNNKEFRLHFRDEEPKIFLYQDLFPLPDLTRA